MEIASNRAKTTLAYNGQYVTDWPDGAVHPDNYVSFSPPQLRYIGLVLSTHVEYSHMYHLSQQCVKLFSGFLELIWILSAHPERIDGGRHRLRNFLPGMGWIPLAIIALTSCQSDISKVTPDNLVVFSVRYQYAPRLPIMIVISFGS